MAKLPYATYKFKFGNLAYASKTPMETRDVLKDLVRITNADVAVARCQRNSYFTTFRLDPANSSYDSQDAKYGTDQDWRSKTGGGGKVIHGRPHYGDPSFALYPCPSDYDFQLLQDRLKEVNGYLERGIVMYSLFLLNGITIDYDEKYKALVRWASWRKEVFIKDMERDIKILTAIKDGSKIALAVMTGGESLFVQGLASAGFTGIIDLFGEGSMNYYHLHDHMDYSAIGIDMLFSFLSSYVGGKVTEKLKEPAVSGAQYVRNVTGSGPVILEDASALPYTGARNFVADQAVKKTIVEPALTIPMESIQKVLNKYRQQNWPAKAWAEFIEDCQDSYEETIKEKYTMFGVSIPVVVEWAFKKN